MRALASMVWVLALALSAPTLALAGPPSGEGESEGAADNHDHGRVLGRVRVAGTRAPVADATVIVVEAPAEVRVGARAREPLDPASVTWTREGATDQDGRFELEAVPLGRVRVVVVASGYERLEVWAESRSDAAELRLFVHPDDDAGSYRTEVVSDRRPELPRAEHRIEGEQARSYPGTGGDPVRAVQNLPGVARAPGGLGLVAVRGGDPRQTGIYVDGHPVPRGFHVLPIAAVVDPSAIDHVEMTPGNFDAAYGGFSGGLLEIHTRRLSGTEGIHGEAHLDLFDLGGAVRAPVGPGGVGFAFRRAHVGDVVKLADVALGKTGILVPNYWDYIARFDMPIRRRHHLSAKAFGAGDALQDETEVEDGQSLTLDFSTAFHRFDLGYAFEGPRLRAALSGAVLLDSNVQGDSVRTRYRRARTLSLRGVLSHRLSRRATLLGGFDFAHTHAHHQSVWDRDGDVDEYVSKQWRLGAWLGAALQLVGEGGTRAVVLRPQVRLNVFGTPTEQRVSPDPRLDVRARVHGRVELFAAFGQYSAPFTIFREDRLGLISSSDTSTAHVVVPNWLVAYFDPGVESETPEGMLLITRTYQASLGTQVELPWSLGLRTTLFWRETPARERGWQTPPSDGFLGTIDWTVRSPAARAYGLELLLDRRLADHIHGMLGYTLLRAENTQISHDWVAAGAQRVPAYFDQRHNLVALLVFELPRAFRFGARFRLVSGNPEEPVIGTLVTQGQEDFEYEPIYGEFGSSYGPLFHQLDLRLDKTWYLRRISLVAYLDVQNAYNRLYPEIWVYSVDWSQRSARIGLPIFPSLGLRVEF